MLPEGGGYPVDGGLEGGPEGEAQRLVCAVAHAAGRAQGLAGGVGQLEVAVHRLEGFGGKTVHVEHKRNINMDMKKSLV